MSDADDMACLREYVRTGSGPAFARLVRRHGNLVYAAALRTTRDPHAAEDVAQTAFAILGRKAHLLANREVSISAWLVKTARFAAIDARRRLLRRREHERQAARLKPECDGGKNPSINGVGILAPIEEAMARLKPKDRQVIALRYFENRAMRDVAQELGCTEEAARQRLGRAIEKLRKVTSP